MSFSGSNMWWWKKKVKAALDITEENGTDSLSWKAGIKLLKFVEDLDIKYMCDKEPRRKIVIRSEQLMMQIDTSAILVLKSTVDQISKKRQ